MTDETVVTGTAPASADAATQAVPTGENPAPTGNASPDAASDPAQAPQPKKVDPRQKKIAELSYRARELERQNERLLGLVEKTTARTTQTTDQPPKMSDFNTVDEYLDARDAYRDRKRTEGQKPAEDRGGQSEQYAHAVQAAREDLMTAGAERYEDFEEVVTADSVKITPVMRDAILELDDHEIQTDVAYYLGKNPKEALRISKLSPMRQVVEIGKLEAKITSAPSPKRPSAAPAPITPVNSGRSVNDPSPRDDDDIKTWMKKRNKQLGRT